MIAVEKIPPFAMDSSGNDFDPGDPVIAIVDGDVATARRLVVDGIRGTTCIVAHDHNGHLIEFAPWELSLRSKAWTGTPRFEIGASVTVSGVAGTVARIGRRTLGVVSSDGGAISVEMPDPDVMLHARPPTSPIRPDAPRLPPREFDVDFDDDAIPDSARKHFATLGPPAHAEMVVTWRTVGHMWIAFVKLGWSALTVTFEFAKSRVFGRTNGGEK